MKEAIKILNRELEKLNEPNPEQDEDDLIDAIIHVRKTADIKMALKILNQFVENSKTFGMMPK